MRTASTSATWTWTRGRSGRSTGTGLLGYAVEEAPEEPCYALDGAFAAVHRAAALVLGSLALTPSQAALVDLMGCAVLAVLERPGSTLEDVVGSCHESTVEELRTRYGWQARAVAASVR